MKDLSLPFRLPLLVALVAACGLLGGCATLTKDDSQPVAFSTDPQGATIFIDGIPRGSTPDTIMIKRSSKRRIVEFKLDGYKSVSMRIQNSVSGMTFGNVLKVEMIGAGAGPYIVKAANYKGSIHVVLLPIDEVEKEPPE